mgnify:CR=1 FL=1
MRVGRLLMAAHLTVAAAESCTGGLLTSRLTDVAGSSAYVKGSVVSYTNEVKMEILGVEAELLRGFGAVSAPVARTMAEQVRRRLDADLGVGITGLAGPGGGTPEKPVGLVFIAVAGAFGTNVRRFQFSGDRGAVKEEAVAAALGMIEEYVAKGCGFEEMSQ